MLRLEELHAGYGSVRVLWGINISVESGEIIALIGANGAGKSTLLNACMGLVPVASGRILLNGTDVTGARPNRIVRAGMTLVPEGRRIFPALTVMENLRVATYGNLDPSTYGDLQALVFELFPRLAERRSQNAGTLSGGEQQMLALGRALMSNARLLLLDEPSLGLAPLVQEQLFERIQRINRQGKTILLVEQNAFLALEISQRAFVIQGGKIVLAGASADLMKSDAVKQSYLGGALEDVE